METVDPKYHDPLLGVAFDLDGTLVLSNHPFERMRREVIRIAERSGVMPGKLSVTQNIPSLVEAALGEIERAGLPEGVKFRFEADVNHRIDELELESLPTTSVRPGAPALLQALNERGYRVGILTRSSATFAQRALKQTGLLPFVQKMRTRSESGPAKPDPEALLLLLQQLEVPPARAIFVGDHLIDAECALRARVRFYAILPEKPGGPGIDSERFVRAGATAVARNLDELSRQLGLLAPPPA
jgi:phosphoglycolate phosphatase-like HAD superfamily hydrolase